MNIAIIIPLYNQVAFTKLCLESLVRHTNMTGVRIIVIDNASTDDTPDYLGSREGITVISNKNNLGCSGAWNQGVKASFDADWLVILNNDVIVSPGWLDGLIEAAERWRLDIVTPAIREGEFNYNIDDYGRDFTCRMKNVIRRGQANGICFMVRRKVFETIGLFDENFRIGQYEDADFFRRAAVSRFRLGIVGNSFLHHFGSVTQKSLKKTNSSKCSSYATENKAYFIHKWKLPWWKRALLRNRNKLTNRLISFWEKYRYGHTLMEKWIDGQLQYK